MTRILCCQTRSPKFGRLRKDYYYAQFPQAATNKKSLKKLTFLFLTHARRRRRLLRNRFRAIDLCGLRRQR